MEVSRNLFESMTIVYKIYPFLQIILEVNGHLDLNLQVFNFLIAILGSMSQVPVNYQVPMGPQVLMVLNINKCKTKY